MKSHLRVRLVLLVTAVMLSSAGVSQSLNPLVTRNPQAAGPVPAYCNESLAPAAEPRIEIADIPEPVIELEPAEIPAPPSGSLRAALQNAQAALARNDRPEFDRALSSARTLLATYPSGAERRTGEELVRTYDAAARLWDAQYQSPFFGEDSPEFAAVSGYPGYREAMRRSTITVEGQRLYPAAESRDFLGRVAADRLRGIGIQQAPTRVTRADAPRRTPAAVSSPSTSRSTTAAPRITSTSPRRMPRQPRSSAPSRPRLSSPATAQATAAPATTPAAAISTPGTPNPPASPAAAAAPEPAAPTTGPGEEAPIAASPATEDPTEDVPATETTDTTESTATTAPTATGAIETPPAPPAPAASTPSRTRSVVLPTILILIGLGVLIVLFRASK